MVMPMTTTVEAPQLAMANREGEQQLGRHEERGGKACYKTNGQARPRPWQLRPVQGGPQQILFGAPPADSRLSSTVRRFGKKGTLSDDVDEPCLVCSRATTENPSIVG